MIEWGQMLRGKAMTVYLQDKYINLLTDFGFKRVFGTEPNKHLLIAFLNTLLPANRQIQDVTFKNNENIGNTPVDRKAIFDIYCQGEFIYIELPKFKKTVDELETHSDKWLFVLKNLAELSDRPQSLQEDVFNELFDVAELANFSSIELDSYQASLKYYRDLNNVVDTSREEGRAEGRVEGRVEGKQSLILQQLSLKLGNIPEETTSQLVQLSSESLNELGIALFRFETIADLKVWLVSRQ
jgi:hypothetical protein